MGDSYSESAIWSEQDREKREEEEKKKNQEEDSNNGRPEVMRDIP